MNYSPAVNIVEIYSVIILAPSLFKWVISHQYALDCCTISIPLRSKKAKFLYVFSISRTIGTNTSFHTLSQQPPVQLVVCYKPSKGLCYCSPQRAVSQAFLLVRYKAVLLESSFLDSSACSFIYFCTASSVILPIVST